MSSKENAFEKFNKKKSELINLVKRGQQVFESLKIESTKKRLVILEGKIRASSFKVLIIGEFNTGKSTFINAMLGEEILPSYPVPCTAILNEIKWGKEKSATLYFKIPQPLKITDGISPEILDHLEKSNGKPSPLKISHQSLKQFVTIKDPAKDPKVSISESPFQKVEINWPLEFLKNGVEFIDSPGLNEHKTRQGITINYLPKVDAVIFLLSSLTPAAASEMHVIENDIVGNSHEDIYFIFNRFDQLRKKEKKAIIEFAYEKLAPKTKLGRKGIFFMSALDAMEGRIDNDEDQVRESGILDFEEELHNFLINNRGRLKIETSCRDLSHRLGEGRSAIRVELKTLSQNLDQLQQKFAQLQPQLRNAERTRDQILNTINRYRRTLHDTVKDKAKIRLNEIADQIPSWAENSETEDIKVFTINHKKEVTKLVNEVSKDVQRRIEENIENWRKEDLLPSIEDLTMDMQEILEGKIKNLFNQLDQIQMDFSGTALSDKEDLDQSAPGWERFLVALGGLLIGDITVAAYGGRFGAKGIGTMIGLQVAAVVTLLALNVANPLVWIGVLVSAGIGSGFAAVGKMTKKIKEKIGLELSNNFKENITASSEKVAKSAFDETAKIEEAAKSFLEEEIQAVEAQFNAALNAKRQGEEAVKMRKNALSKQQKEIDLIQSELSEILLDFKK